MESQWNMETNKARAQNKAKKAKPPWEPVAAMQHQAQVHLACYFSSDVMISI